MILCPCLWADRAILEVSAKIEHPAVAVGMQRKQVKPLHAAYGTTAKVGTEYRKAPLTAVANFPRFLAPEMVPSRIRIWR